MGWFKKIFGSNSKLGELSKEMPEKKEVMVGISSVYKGKLPTSAEIVTEFQIPLFCSIGNLIFEKKYHEAIELGNTLLEKTPKSAEVHVNLMQAYFKVRNEHSKYNDKTIEHARLAMLYGHNTGLVQKRLVISLEKQGNIFQAIQLCNIILLDEFRFSKHGFGNKEEFIKRKEKLLKKISKTVDKEDDILFSREEITHIMELIRLDEEREEKELVEFEEKLKQLKKENDELMKSFKMKNRQ